MGERVFRASARLTRLMYSRTRSSAGAGRRGGGAGRGRGVRCVRRACVRVAGVGCMRTFLAFEGLDVCFCFGGHGVSE